MAEKIMEIDDKLDWSLLDQLHSVVLQIGTFCFRTKQICLSVLVGVIGIITVFTAEKLDTSIFIAGLLIPIGFWFLDSIAYYYQVKIRGVMDKIRQRIHQRNSKDLISDVKGEVITTQRVDRSSFLRVKDAFFNHSMWLYYLLIFIDISLWIIYKKGVIQ